jgi:hypothetical protein
MCVVEEEGARRDKVLHNGRRQAPPRLLASGKYLLSLSLSLIRFLQSRARAAEARWFSLLYHCHDRAFTYTDA